MREVSIHAEDNGRAVGQRLLEAGDVGGAQAKLAGAMDDTYQAVLACQPVCNVAGAIGRIVVNDDHLQAQAKIENLRDKTFDILSLVVGWNDDCPPGAGAGVTAGSDMVRSLRCRSLGCC